jgi:tryptophan halogenase
MMKNIVIVGGGTAGWLSALFLKRKYPIYNVTLIESTVIGILGAGEGGTPNLKSIIVDYFGFDENEFLEKVNGTKKYGIIFDKWHKDLNHSFVHGFGYDGLENDLYSYHFNARLFAEFLKNKSVERGVNHIDAEISEFINLDNNINTIVLNTGDKIVVDFVFDCSGFSRMVIGKLHKTKWNSYEDELIINSALPFFINKPNKEINQRTIAEAIDYGWMWKIPLQDRWGCGYLYNNQMVDDEKIASEISRLHSNENITINKKIKFNPGVYENVWVENSLAIGLSSGFLEPLEATSIMTIIYQLRHLPEDIFDYSKRDEYNRNVNIYNNQNMIFLRHHYNCSRNDTIFWKTYRDKKLPPILEKVYSTINTQEKIADVFGVNDNVVTFTKEQYVHVMNNNFLKKEKTLI